MHNTEVFLSILDEQADEFFFQTFDDSPDKDPSLVRTFYSNFNEVQEELNELNDVGAGVFACINHVKTGEKRSNENIGQIRAVFVDLDGSPLAPVLEAELEPHMVINSGGGDDHYHAYWLVDGLPVSEFPDIQRGLAARFGGDPKVCDPARVMRLPGFRNNKHGIGASVYMLDVASGATRPFSADAIRKHANVAGSRPPAPPKPKIFNDGVIPDGQRNEVLFRKTCSYRGKGISIKEAGLLISAINSSQCASPLSENELSTLIGSAYSQRYQEKDSEQSFTYDDLGNARKMVDKYGGIFRYISESGQWMLLNEASCLWERSTQTAVRHLAQRIGDQLKDDADKLSKKAAENPALEDIADAAEKWAKSSRNSSKITAMCTEAASMPEVSIYYDTFDANPMLLCLRNGVLDLGKPTPAIVPVKPTDYFTKRAEVAYDPKADCPRWREFVLSCCSGDYELAEYVQRAVGYSMTARTDEQVFFMIIGPGGNGKSTFLELLRKMMGAYAAASDGRVFQTRSPDAPSNDIARLAGARFITAPELSATRRIDDGLVKQLVGGDKIVARHLYKDHFEFPFIGKIWISGNERPDVSDISNGIWRRLRLVEFKRDLTEGERDNGLLDKLTAEMPGVLNWAIEGCAKWQKVGLADATAVTESRESYREETDSIDQWAAECVEDSPGSRVKMGSLQTSYFEWCKECGVTAKQLNQFRSAMRGRYRFVKHAKIIRACDVRLVRPGFIRED